MTTNSMSQQRDFFTTLFMDLAPGEMIQQAYFTRRGEEKEERWEWKGAKNVAEAVAIAQTAPEDADVFVGVLPRIKPGGKKEAVAATGSFLWCDIDDKANILWKALPPTMVVYSGNGIHAYWRLTDRLVVEEIEKLNRLMTLFGMDQGTYNCNRVLRVPGTLNHKYSPAKPCGLLVYQPDFVYSPNDISAFFRAINPKLLDRIIYGSMIGFQSDRSKRDFSVIAPLIKEGASEGLLYRIFENTAIGTKKDDRYGERYFETSIKNALAKVNHTSGEGFKTTEGITKLEDLPLVEPAKPLFTYRNDGTYYDGRRVASFVFAPQMAIENTQRQIVSIVGQMLGPGGASRLTLKSSDLHTVRDMLGALPGFTGTWLGGRDPEVRAYCDHLIAEVITRGLPRVVEATCLGRHGHVFVAKNVTVGPQGPFEDMEAPVIVNDDKLVTPPMKLSFSQMSNASSNKSAALVRMLYDKLPRLNEPSVIWPLIGWYMSCLWSPLFTQNGFMFPLMSVFGTRGAGKTELQRQIFLPLLGNTEGVTYELDTKEFVLMRLMSGSNAIPVVLGDFRRAYTSRAETVFKLALQLYDQTTAQRGRASLHVNEYPLRAPVLVHGEDMFVEETGAMRERILTVNMKPKTVEPGQEANEVFHELKKQNLGQLAPHLLLYSLNNSPDMAKASAMLNHTYQIMSERVRNNLVVALCGIMGFLDFCQKAGQNEVFEINEKWIRSVFNPMLAHIGNQIGNRTRILLDDFVEDVLAELGRPGTELPHKYDYTKGYMYVSLNEANIWWQRQRIAQRKTFLDRPAMTQQIEERSAYYIEGISFAYIPARRSRHYCICINVPKAYENGLHVPMRGEKDG